MANREKLATWDTPDTRRRQSKNTTLYVLDTCNYTQTNTNNVNKTLVRPPTNNWSIISAIKTKILYIYD